LGSVIVVGVVRYTAQLHASALDTGDADKKDRKNTVKLTRAKKLVVKPNETEA